MLLNWYIIYANLTSLILSQIIKHEQTWQFFILLSQLTQIKYKLPFTVTNNTGLDIFIADTIVRLTTFHTYKQIKHFHGKSYRREKRTYINKNLVQWEAKPHDSRACISYDKYVNVEVCSFSHIVISNNSFLCFRSMSPIGRLAIRS